MATDARGHTVPASTDHPSRATLLNLSLGIRDLIPTATTTTRATLISALTAAGQGPSTSNPIYVFRADARPDAAIEVTTDGTTWRSIPMSTNLQSFTPVLAASTTSPTLGTGSSVAGQYVQTGDPWVEGNGTIDFGTAGAAAGSGTFTLSLPVAGTSAAVTNGDLVGDAGFFDSSGGRFYICKLRIVTATTARLVEVSAGTFVSSSSPVAVAINDVINYSFGYVPA